MVILVGNRAHVAHLLLVPDMYGAGAVTERSSPFDTSVLIKTLHTSAAHLLVVPLVDRVGADTGHCKVQHIVYELGGNHVLGLVCACEAVPMT